MSIELKEYIEDKGFTPVKWGKDWFQSPEGELWTVDEVERVMGERPNEFT